MYVSKYFSVDRRILLVFGLFAVVGAGIAGSEARRTAPLEPRVDTGSCCSVSFSRSRCCRTSSFCYLDSAT